MKKKRVGLLVALSDLNPAYSIAGVVLDQIRMMCDQVDLTLITTEEFRDADMLPANVKLRTYPRPTRYISPIDERFDEVAFRTYVMETGSVLVTQLRDLDYVITHDLLFLDCFLWANCAIREAQQSLPKIKWLHWVHSGPTPRKELTWPMSELYRPMPKSIYCYPNRTDVIKVAEMFQTPVNNVQVVHNSVDPIGLFNFHPLSTEIFKVNRLWEQDLICVYPTRCTHAKQPHKLIKLMAYAKAHRRRVKLIVCNSWANGEAEIEFTRSMREHANQLGLGSDLIITSELGEQWILGVPKQVVTDLMRVSDLFVMPSISETASLVMLEAALSKNLVVVNEDLQCMHEFGGQMMNHFSSSRVLYSPLGSITKNQADETEDWYSRQAEQIIRSIDEDRCLTYFRYVRKYHSPQWVWENQILPLLH